jgi:hypothetical protein
MKPGRQFHYSRLFTDLKDVNFFKIMGCINVRRALLYRYLQNIVNCEEAELLSINSM